MYTYTHTDWTLGLELFILAVNVEILIKEPSADVLKRWIILATGQDIILFYKTSAEYTVSSYNNN